MRLGVKREIPVEAVTAVRRGEVLNLNLDRGDGADVLDGGRELQIASVLALHHSLPRELLTVVPTGKGSGQRLAARASDHQGGLPGLGLKRRFESVERLLLKRVDLAIRLRLQRGLGDHERRPRQKIAQGFCGHAERQRVR